MKSINIPNEKMQEAYYHSKTKCSWLKKHFISFVLFFGFALVVFLPGIVKSQVPIYLNPSYSFRERATDLVSRMTIEEKQSQLGNTMSPIPRLSVKKYDVWG